MIPLEPPHPDVRRALVLSGGGARGAYEAGVISYLFEELPRALGHVPRFEVFAGTSVGAVNACLMAGHADDPRAGAARLREIWSELSFDRVYSFGARDALSFVRTLFGSVSGEALDDEASGSRIHGLLNTTPLERLVIGSVPWRRLRRNIREGTVAALCVSTTEIASGQTVIWVDNRERSVPTWTNDAIMVGRPGRIGPQHALASAAIPLLFPAVRIGATYYCDGGLRQHSPLSPALRLGANRVMAIGLRHERVATLDDPLAGERVEQFRSIGFLVGKILNTIFSDRLEVDLGHMRVINQILRAGVEIGGAPFLDRLNEGVTRLRGMGFQLVEDCLVRPGKDIGAIAGTHVERLERASGGTLLGRFTLRMMRRGAPRHEADLMSYVLFDGEYAAELIELGRADARAQQDDLLRFFSS